MRIIAIANAKGGVGKSFVASSLSHALSESGKSVVLVDLDPHVPTVDLLCPDVPIGGLWSGSDAATQVHPVTERLSVLIAGPTSLSTSEADDRLTMDWAKLNPSADFVIIDLGPGLTRLHDSVFAAADQLVLVLTPTPTSLLGALRTTRAAFTEKPKSEIAFVVNKTASKLAAKRVAQRFVESTGRFLSQEASYWGFIANDPHVVLCDVKKETFITKRPRSATSKHVTSIAARLTGFQGFVDETSVVTSLRTQAPGTDQKAA